MRIVCASICYRGYADDEVAGTLENAPAIGYKYMEIHGPMIWSVEAVDAFDAQAVKARVAEAGMTCFGLYPPGWGGADEEDVRKRSRAIAKCVELAEKLGCYHVSTSGASKRGEEGGLQRVISCVEQVLALVPPDSEIKMGLEPHYGNIMQEREDFEIILAAIDDPRVGICVDTGHFHSAGLDTVKLIRDFGPRIHSVHLKDHIGTASVGIGRGEIDLPSEIAALREIGYRGGLTIELEVEDPENLPRYTEEAYIYISGLLGTKL